MRANDPFPEHRQIGIIDYNDTIAGNTRTSTVPHAEHRCGKEFIVLGKVVASQAVIDAMVSGFMAAEGQPLAERLLRGVEGGRDAGDQLTGSAPRL